MSGTERFDTGRAMTEDELYKAAPSVFAKTARPDKSDRFAPIATIDAVRALAEEGFSVVGARQCVARREGNGSPFGKHLLRIRRLNDTDAHRVGDTVFEMLLKNANDGSSKWNLMGGLFRIACLNSMVAALASLENIAVRHTGDALKKVIEGTFTVLKEGQKAIEAPLEWSKINLSGEQRLDFAEAAHIVRFGDAEGNVGTTSVKPAQLLEPRRMEDARHDLWSTFNVVQENAVRGGISSYGPNANGHYQRHRTRAINGIDQDLKLNKALWMIAQSWADYAKAA
jgi:hypothetical protein